MVARMKSEGIPESFLRNINELLPNCNWAGAYCMGLLTYVGLQHGHWAPYPVLEVASHANSLETAMEVHRTVEEFAANNGKTPAK